MVDVIVFYKLPIFKIKVGTIMLQGGGIAMKLNIDEILDLYFKGYYLKDILSVIPGTKENKEINKSKSII